VTERYLDTLLFSGTTLGYYFYDKEVLKENSFLTVQKFNHSTAFEFVWAAFPTTIIILILVPSMLLLYSLDEDLDPKLTIKVIGHQ
jgi:heme/copper-type cytochrome/quinol oxidase subunit 2